MLRFLVALYVIVIVLFSLNPELPNRSDLRSLLLGVGVISLVVWFLHD